VSTASRDATCSGSPSGRIPCATTVAPYVVRVLHRYLLGPDTTATVKVKLFDEGIALDTAPRPVELDPDSAAAGVRADSVRRAGER